MAIRLLAVTFDAREPAALARFWAGRLDRSALEDRYGAWWVGGAEPELTLRFVASPRDPAERGGLNRMHCDLTNASAEEQAAHVAAALADGGSHLDVGQVGDEGHVVLADPEGNAFDEIEAGNGFLAGTGRIGCLACDGSEAVGRFWSAALDWPLVWDQDEETAIQSPDGGSKISWGGPPVEPLDGRSRVRFHLAPSEDSGVREEVTRLQERGLDLAGAIADGHGGWELRDPDGTEFTLAAGTTSPYA